MQRLPRRYAPFVFGVIQAAITTGLATAIATASMGATGAGFLTAWLEAWGLAWLTMLPVVAVVAPLIRRAVEAMTTDV